MPNRLFRYDGRKWVNQAQDVRMTMSNEIVRNTYKTQFINNEATNDIDGETIEERQSLSKALKPKADN